MIELVTRPGLTESGNHHRWRVVDTNMRLTHTFSWLDVRIIVSDNVTVMAHKAMLAFRFPPFAQAFKPVPAEEDVTLIATGILSTMLPLTLSSFLLPPSGGSLQDVILKSGLLSRAEKKTKKR